jgi:hypothetical protein
VIGGNGQNVLGPNVIGATISGGGGVFFVGNTSGRQMVTDNFGTIGGGLGNRAGNGTGTENDANYATVSGGGYNTARGAYSTVIGGEQNIAQGLNSVVAGGYLNLAYGDYSFAAGRVALTQASHPASFVWAGVSGDGGIQSTSSFGPGTFTVRAFGGVRFYTTDFGTTTGVELPAGGGAWASLSDRTSKENFTPVDSRAVLESVARLPLTTWNYIAQDDATRHMGVTAQDFYASFGLGESDTRITTVDADGVALAAIQGLYQVVQEQDAKIADLEARLARLEGLASGGQPAGVLPAALLIGVALAGWGLRRKRIHLQL